MIPILDIAALPGPRQMAADEHALAGRIARSQVEQRKTKRAGEHRIHAELALKAAAVHTGSTFDVAEADGVLRRQIVREPGLAVGESERHGRLIAEIDPIQDVVQITFSKRYDPGSA